MKKTSILLFLIAVVLIAFQQIGPFIYRECGNTDRHLSSFQMAVYEITTHEKLFSIIAIVLGLAVALFIIHFVIQTFKNKSYGKTRKILTVVIAAPLLVCVLALGLLLGTARGVIGSGGPDYQQMQYTRKWRGGLELYYDDHGRYPNTIRELYTSSDYKELIDPITKEPYGYAISNDGQSYVMQVQLGTRTLGCFEPTPGLHYLEDDLDGVVFGLNCNDPAYCVGSSIVNGELMDLK